MYHLDPFTRKNIPLGNGIWKSGCLIREEKIAKEISIFLTDQGWDKKLKNGRVWTKENKKIVVCLVDHHRHLNGKLDEPIELYGKDCLVVTDNQIHNPQHDILNLPNSFFGIYNNNNFEYVTWQPERKFSFSINRIDLSRLEVFLALSKQLGINEGYVNFNCQWPGNFACYQKNYEDYFKQLSVDKQKNYKNEFDKFYDNLPFRNYDIDQSLIFSKSQLNLEVETYCYDTTVALSEKIFRLLTTPAPWICLSGYKTVEFLEKLGFDCLRDICPHHNYDLIENTSMRLSRFVDTGLDLIDKFGRHNDQQKQFVYHRALESADTNRKLLKHFESTWPSDFENWLVSLQNKIETFSNN